MPRTLRILLFIGLQLRAEEPARTIEGLNLLGGSASMPLFKDSAISVDSTYRRKLFAKGMAFRAVVLPRNTFNVLDGPVPKSQQVYIGQRPTWITGLNPILTWDLRQLKLRNAQLQIGAGWRWTTWNPAGPKTISITTLYFFKMWRERRVEMRAGYITNDTDFIGLQVGGQLATGAQGVYAVLPYQVGMSFFPFTAPSVNVRLRGPGKTYFKMGAQRSLDAAGNLVNQARNQTGFRFAPHGAGLLLIHEAGYQQAASETARQTWIRAGYLRNNSLYVNRATGLKEEGNYCVFALADYQIRKPEKGPAANGVFIGGTFMSAPSRFNSYDKYWEARLYQRAPFESRKDDVVTLVAAFRGHSNDVTKRLAAQGRTYWQSSESITGSYSLHVAPGNYITLAAGFVRGPAIAPRVSDTLTVTVTWGLYL